MSRKNVLIKGALILTIAGILSRFIGFFYRIFLSNTIGAEGMGIYQLIFPIYALCFSLSAASIQTAISRFVATKLSSDHKQGTTSIIRAGLILSMSISLLISFILYNYSDFLAVRVVGEARCSELLKYLAFSVPLTSIHSCINGYYYGYQKASVPAWSQLVEQLFRVVSVYLIAMVAIESGYTLDVKIAGLGIVLGEASSVVYCVLSYCCFQAALKRRQTAKKSDVKHETRHYIRKIFTLSLPLTINRVMLNILQSVEAILIPLQLRHFGLTSSESLSIYGVLTGMAFPFIFFPSAITNSIAVMLLPAIAEAQSNNDKKLISITTSKTVKFNLLIGIFCAGIFVVFGKQMGQVVYHNENAGTFMIILAWLCPFLYLTTTLGSILNGLGKTTTTFVHNLLGIMIRIGFILYFVPKFGIIGYLWGLLVSQLTISALHFIFVCKDIHISFSVFDWLVKPIFAMLCSLGAGYLISNSFQYSLHLSPAITLLLSCLLTTGLFYIFLILTKTIDKKML